MNRKSRLRLQLRFQLVLIVVQALLNTCLVSADQADSGPQFKGFSTKISGDIYGQPKVFIDIDGDGKQEIIFGATDGKVHVVKANGQQHVVPQSWPKQTNAPILAEVNVVDLDGDNVPEVLACSLNGKVYCLNSVGRELWTHETRGNIGMSAPEVADMDGSGELKIFVGSRAGTVSKLAKDGGLEWEVRLSSTVSARVTAVDINGDGVKELIAKDDSGKVTVLRGSGMNYPGWPVDTTQNLAWPFEVGAADINGDGVREIFTTTPDRKFMLWHHNGQLRSEFGLTDAAHAAPRVADLDGDGRPEFIIGQADGTVMVCDEKGRPLPGWPHKTGHAIYHTPQVIDLDGDGRLDLVFTAWNPEGAGKQAGYVMALSRTGMPLPGYPKYIGKTIAPVTFADLDGDGYLEMIAAGGINFTADQLHVFPTHARVQIKMAVLGSEVVFK